MDKEKMEEILDSLSEVSHYCDIHPNCKECIFIIDGCCTFFAKPWDWNIGWIKEKL